MEVLLCERVNDPRHSLSQVFLELVTKSHREQGLDYREGEELSWCPSWSNSLWQGWSCGLVHCPGGNATDPIFSSSRIIVCTVPTLTSNCALIVSIDTPRRSLSMKFFIWPINSGVLTSLLLPHLSSSLTDSLPSLNLLCHSKTDARFMQDGPKAVWSIPYVSVAFFPSLKQNFIAYRSSKMSSRPDLHFWNSPAVTIRL